MRHLVALAPAFLLPLCGAAVAADLRRTPPAPAVPFAPTEPVGVASQLPRSPLTDLVVDAPLRFATSEEAQRHCPTDVVVWVPFGSNYYRLDRVAVSAAGPGAFLCQADASSEGDLPLRDGVAIHK